MQPLPVQRSRIRAGGSGFSRSARRQAHSSVSGRGIKVGGRTLRSRGPNGWFPG